MKSSGLLIRFTIDFDETALKRAAVKYGRQLLHLTYGSVLSATQDGSPRFKDQNFEVLHAHEEEHCETLKKHVLRHLRGLYPDADL